MRNWFQAFAFKFNLYRYSKADRAEEDRKQTVMARIAGRVMNRTISGAFDRWLEAAQELKRTRAIMTRIASKIANRSLCQSFDLWCDSMEDAKVGLYKLNPVDPYGSSLISMDWSFLVIELAKMKSHILGNPSRDA